MKVCRVHCPHRIADVPPVRQLTGSTAPNQPINETGGHLNGVPIITGGMALNVTFEPHLNNMNPVFAPIFQHRRYCALIESEFEGEVGITNLHGGYEPVGFEIILIRSVGFLCEQIPHDYRGTLRDPCSTFTRNV